MTVNTYTSNFQLNDSLIQKLKTAESETINKSLSENLNKINTLSSIQDTFSSLVGNFSDFLKFKPNDYSADIQGGINIKKSENPQEGSYQINIESLYKENVFQSEKYNKNSLYGDGEINVNNQSFITTGKTVEEVVKDLQNAGINANFDMVSESQGRIIIKGNVQTESFEQVQEGSNLKLTIDGVNYEFQSNTFKFRDMEIQATKIGDAKLEVKKDSLETQDKLLSMVDKYNDLISYANDTMLYNDKFTDKSSVKNFLNELKTTFFDSNAFQNGFNLDEHGKISVENVSSEKATEIIEKLSSKIEELKPSITSVKEMYYARKDEISKLMEANLKNLDLRYQQMSNQFLNYNQIISSMELNFSSLKNLISLQYKS